jgi:CRISPR-associated protein Cas2
MGWIMIIFDLPVLMPEQRRVATKFRNWLLDDGYLMIQYSVYARPCISYEHLEKHSQRIVEHAPHSGYVRVMFFTDKQWQLGINIIGDDSYLGHREASPEMPSQIIFW